MFYNLSMPNLIRPNIAKWLMLFVGCGLLATSGCATVSTKHIDARDALKTNGRSLTWKKIKANAATGTAATGVTKRGKLSLGEVNKLRTWAGSDADRLKEVAAVFIRKGERLQKSADPTAPGYFLAATEFAYRSLLASGGDASRWATDFPQRERLETYNYSLTRFIETHRKSRGDWPRSVSVSSPAGDYHITESKPAFGTREINRYDQLIPVAQLRIKGFTERKLEAGVGSRLVGIRTPTPDRNWEMAFHTPKGTEEPLTAIITFPKQVTSSQKATFYLLNTTERVSVPTRHGDLPLATNFTGPIALLMDGLNDRLIGLSGIFNVGKQMDKAGTYMIGPYQKNKIPVLMIHGLQSSPLIWRNMIDDLMQVPEIRRNYQFWLYYYPTGLTTPESASRLRANVRDIRAHFDPKGQDRASKHMVVVGHSMGGVLARTMVADVGTHLWDEIANRPFSEATFSPQDRKKAADILFWDVDPSIEQAIFLSAPHRGAKMADNILGKIGRGLVRLPKQVMSFHHVLFDQNRDILKHSAMLKGRLTGVRSLSPTSPLVSALEESPFSKYVSYHSIIGDRGKGDTPDSSDGVVAYWSSHLDGADSEIIVSTGHNSYTSPLAVEEVQRILTLNLKK